MKHELSLEELSPYPGRQVAGFISEITNALTLDESPVPYFRSATRKLRCHTGFICLTLLN